MLKRLEPLKEVKCFAVGLYERCPEKIWGISKPTTIQTQRCRNAHLFQRISRTDSLEKTVLEYPARPWSQRWQGTQRLLLPWLERAQVQVMLVTDFCIIHVILVLQIFRRQDLQGYRDFHWHFKGKPVRSDRA
jgi:hypothetical protein